MTCVLVLCQWHSEFSYVVAKYVANCVSHRQRDGSLQLSGVDDARNGLLLASILHRAFGDVEMAFIHVSGSDVPLFKLL